jgi:ABC-type branched-subunit amino acid transport system substrate-binding protein
MLRRLRLAAALLLLPALAACQASTVFEKGAPKQAAPAQSAPVATTPAAPVAPVTVMPEGGAATPSTGTQGEPGAIKIGLLLPLSGPSAAIGGALLNAAELAMFDAGVANFALLPRDTQGTADGAERAARAVLGEGAKLILGPFFAAEVSAAAPVARQAGANVVAFSTDEHVAGQGVYLMGFLPRSQVARVVSFARSKGLRRFAAIVPENAYGDAIANLLREAVSGAGGEIVDIESYDPQGNDAAQVVRRLANYETRRNALLAQRQALAGKSDEVSQQALQRLDSEGALGGTGFDAVMLPEGGERLLALAPLLPYYDIDPARVRFLGTGQWDDARLGKEPALLGGWYAAPDPSLRADFETRYAKTYGSAPPRIATLGYDATALAAALAKAGGDFGAQAITNPNGFAGLDGIFRFRPDGLSERGLAVLEVQRDGPKVASPAPASFVGE